MPSGAVDLRLRGAISGRGANFTFTLGSADVDVGEEEEEDAVVCVLAEEEAGVCISDGVCCVSSSNRGLGEGDDSVEDDASILDVSNNPASRDIIGWEQKCWI
jgi:hypothetical protein